MHWILSCMLATQLQTMLIWCKQTTLIIWSWRDRKQLGLKERKETREDGSTGQGVPEKKAKAWGVKYSPHKAESLSSRHWRLMHIEMICRILFISLRMYDLSLSHPIVGYERSCFSPPQLSPCAFLWTQQCSGRSNIILSASKTITLSTPFSLPPPLSFSPVCVCLVHLYVLGPL